MQLCESHKPPHMSIKKLVASRVLEEADNQFSGIPKIKLKYPDLIASTSKTT